jgi:hypothetical protein
MRIYKEAVRKGIIENCEQRNNNKVGTSETKWEVLREW